MNKYAVGQIVDFEQVKHSVPMEEHNTAIPIHESPKSGRGEIQVATRHGTEWSLFVLAEKDRGKKDAVSLLLRVPPDRVTVLR